MILANVFMTVPAFRVAGAAAVNLNEPHALLDHPTSHEALPPEVAGFQRGNGALDTLLLYPAVAVLNLPCLK